MPGDQNITPSRLRVDYSTAGNYIQQDNYKPKSHFFSKMFSFLGPIGAAVTAVALPGIGLPIAAGIYGLSNVAADQTNRALINDQIKASAQPQPTNVGLPGLFDTAQSPGLGATDFIAPSH